MSVIDSLQSQLTQSIQILKSHLLDSGVREQDIDAALFAAGLVRAQPPVEGRSDRKGKDLREKESRRERNGRNHQEKSSRKQLAKATKAYANVPTSARNNKATGEQNGKHPSSFDVRLWEDVVAGQKLIVKAPSGKSYEVVVPHDAPRDTLLSVSVPEEEESPPPSDEPVHQEDQETTNSVRREALYDNPKITDAHGDPLRTTDPKWKWWISKGVLRVGDLFDEQANLHSHIHLLTTTSEKSAELDALCGAIPMHWRDVIYDAFTDSKDAEKRRLAKQKGGSKLEIELKMAPVSSEPGSKKYADNPMANSGRGAK